MHWIHERPAHAQRPTLTVGCSDQGVDRPIAAIGYRHEDEVGIGRRSQDAVANRFSGLEGRQRALERVGRDHDAHQRIKR